MFCRNCGAKTEECTCRAAQESEPPAWWAKASSDLVKQQEQSIEKALGPMRKDVSDMKRDIGQLREGHNNLEQRVTRLEEGGACTQAWKPNFVDIVGFCKFEKVQEEGITRTEAAPLIGTIKSLLDPCLQRHVGNFEIRGSRNYLIKILINPDYLTEIKNVWAEALK